MSSLYRTWNLQHNKDFDDQMIYVTRDIYQTESSCKIECIVFEIRTRNM